MEVPAFSQLEDFDVDIDRSGPPGVVSMMGWSGNSTATLRWDETRATVFMMIVRGIDVELTADRSQVSKISVYQSDGGPVEFAVRWGAPGTEQVLLMRILDPIEVSDTPVSH